MLVTAQQPHIGDESVPGTTCLGCTLASHQDHVFLLKNSFLPLKRRQQLDLKPMKTGGAAP